LLLELRIFGVAENHFAVNTLPLKMVESTPVSPRIMETHHSSVSRSSVCAGGMQNIQCFAEGQNRQSKHVGEGS